MDRRRDRIAIPEVSTTHWIWSNSSYVEWDRAPSGILWIQGKPGSGKSVLAKSIQSQLLQLDNSSMVSISARPIVGAWYYSERHSLRDHSMMLRSLLLQVLEQDRSLFKYVQYSGLDGENWSGCKEYSASQSDILQRILTTISTSQENHRQICCLVDGLDESKSSDQALESLEEMLLFFKRLVGPSSRFKLICLSRSVHVIEKSLRHTYSIILQQENLSDIEQIVDAGLSSITQAWSGDDSSDEEDSDADFGPVEDDYNQNSTDSRTFTELTPQPRPQKGRKRFKAFAGAFQRVKGVKEDHLENIRRYLIKHANGVILWVTTILKTLETRARKPLCDLKRLEEELYRLPVDLAKLYGQILKGLIDTLDEDTIGDSRRALGWVSVVTAVRPFQLQELLAVLAMEKDLKINSWRDFRQQLQDLCGPFIEVIRPAGSPYGGLTGGDLRKDDEVQLLHQTVKDFLEDGKAAGRLHIPNDEAELMVKEESRKYIEVALPSKPSDYLPLPVQPNSDWKRNVKDIAAYLERCSLLPFISHSYKCSRDWLPDVYKFMFQNTTSPPLMDLSQQQKTELVYIERRYASPDAAKGQSAIIERFFRTACENGWVTAVENIFLLSSLRFSREQMWEWYHDEPAIIYGTLLAAIRHGMIKEVKCLIFYTAIRGFPIIYGDDGTELKETLLTREALQSRNEELALVVLGYADEVERQQQLEFVRKQHEELPSIPSSKGPKKLLKIKKAIHAVLQFWGCPHINRVSAIYHLADLGVNVHVSKEYGANVPSVANPSVPRSLSYRRLLQEAKSGGMGDQHIYRPRIPPLATDAALKRIIRHVQRV